MADEEIRSRRGPKQTGEMREPDFPNIEARNRFDFEQHVKRAMEAGMSREEAEAHAREDMQGEDEAHIDAFVDAARKKFGSG